jgi:hypothetical protein
VHAMIAHLWLQARTRRDISPAFQRWESFGTKGAAFISQPGAAPQGS